MGGSVHRDLLSNTKNGQQKINFRWKEKVQSLTKQLREMDMVMKKYMTEVQKQNKERNFQLLAPLRVTRSVGLQVSFSTNVRI